MFAKRYSAMLSCTVALSGYVTDSNKSYVTKEKVINLLNTTSANKLKIRREFKKENRVRACARVMVCEKKERV